MLVQDGGAVRIRGLLQGVHACAKGITQMHVRSSSTQQRLLCVGSKEGARGI